MPRDLNKELRTPSFRSKLNTMTGLSAEEKAMFVRIGNLIDVLSYSQRQLSNPRGDGAKKLSTSIPTPRNVQVFGAIGGAEMSWDPINLNRRGDGLDHYEVQFDDSNTFSDPVKLELISTRVVVKTSSDEIALRVRAVTKRGLVSEWSTTATLSAPGTFFLADQDAINPENRTAVDPQPELAGGSLDNTGGGASIFTGIGASVGPSPFTIDDLSSGVPTDVNLRNDITFTLHENADPTPGIEQRYLETVAGEFLEQENFYTYAPHFYIRPQILTGSFTDFFNIVGIASAIITADVEFLRYRNVHDSFYPHIVPQAGNVLDASMSTIKF